MSLKFDQTNDIVCDFIIIAWWQTFSYIQIFFIASHSKNIVKINFNVLYGLEDWSIKSDYNS